MRLDAFFCTLLLSATAVAQPFEIRDRRFLNAIDLTATEPGFDPRTGAVTFELVNRGGVAANAPFKIDVGRDSLRTTVEFSESKMAPAALRTGRTVPIQPYERRRVNVADLKVEQCSGNHSISVTIDTGQAVAEADESNNQMQRTVEAPCPDLTVVSIGKNWNNLHTEYGAEVTIKNQGTGWAGRFNVFAVTSNQLTGIFTLPDSPYRVYESMAPGETSKFTVGNALAVEKMWVRVVVDMPNWNKESDENNNEMRKTLN
jgi:subtilase family serine protease